MAEKISASLDNLLQKLHETYRDCEEQKKRVVTELKQRNKGFVPDSEGKEFDQMTALAAANNKTYDVLNTLIKNKTELLKVQASLIKGIKEVEVSNQEIEKKEYQRIEQTYGLSEEHMAKIREMAKNSNYEFDDE